MRGLYIGKHCGGRPLPCSFLVHTHTSSLAGSPVAVHVLTTVHTHSTVVCSTLHVLAGTARAAAHTTSKALQDALAPAVTYLTLFYAYPTCQRVRARKTLPQAHSLSLSQSCANDSGLFSSASSGPGRVAAGRAGRAAAGRVARPRKALR